MPFEKHLTPPDDIADDCASNALPGERRRAREQLESQRPGQLVTEHDVNVRICQRRAGMFWEQR